MPEQVTLVRPRTGCASVERRDALSSPAALALAGAFAVLIAVKMPNILLEGRFWAEEGAKFFVNAWQLPWPQALLAPWGGYLNITANLAGILAWHAPKLAWAPYASTLLALLFQVCPAILLLTAGLPWLRRPWAMVAALLLIATPPAAEEVWLSSIGTQVHLTLCAALILACATRGGAVGAFRLALLALAGLSGPGPWVFVPLFAVRAAAERSWARVLQTAVLGATVVIQAAFFYSRMPGRTYAVHPVLYLDMAFAKHVLIPFLGPARALPIAAGLRDAALAGHLPLWPAAAMALIIVLAGCALAPDWRREPFWMVLAAAVFAGESYFGSLGNLLDGMGGWGGERYAFVPQVLIALALLGCALTRRGVIRLVAAGCVIWLLGVGLYNYFLPINPVFAEGPSWRSELAQHVRDPAHVIRSWPPGWIVPLPPGGR